MRNRAILSSVQCSVRAIKFHTRSASLRSKTPPINSDILLRRIAGVPCPYLIRLNLIQMNEIGEYFEAGKSLIVPANSHSAPIARTQSRTIPPKRSKQVKKRNWKREVENKTRISRTTDSQDLRNTTLDSDQDYRVNLSTVTCLFVRLVGSGDDRLHCLK